MKSTMVAGAVLGALLVTSRNVGAATFIDGNKLVAHMKEYEKAERGEPFEGVGDGIFLGYVTGVIDTLGDALCLPDNVSNRQVTAIAAKYLNGHPDQWNQPAPQLVMRAMRAAFPCR